MVAGSAARAVRGSHCSDPRTEKTSGGVGRQGSSVRRLARRLRPWPYPKPSTAPNLIDSQQIRIIHPFHPLCGRSFRFVVSKKLWGEDRVTIQLADGSPFSVPVSWTDVVPADAYTSVGGGRSRFRVEALMALADLLVLTPSR